MIRPLLEKTPYELLKGRKPNISHLREFVCKCFVHINGKNSLGKFDPKSDEGVFWDALHIVKPIKYITRELCVYKRFWMLSLMKLTFSLRGKNKMMKRLD